MPYIIFVVILVLYFGLFYNDRCTKVRRKKGASDVTQCLLCYCFSSRTLYSYQQITFLAIWIMSVYKNEVNFLLVFRNISMFYCCGTSPMEIKATPVLKGDIQADRGLDRDGEWKTKFSLSRF